ncbi:hypothetical protein [Halorubrum tropicale]|uniref:Uncharacterized protein n=1 Tax=Halorubrum tropicale TaxID=1765655 RepID=A0A0N1IUK9_9EURY|nr:hypothetical protein [Halorubrum tropicale]KOX93256.1 hypothetical protein AMR74_16575 [Halorubrum tropicale]
MGDSVANICASDRFRAYLQEFRKRHPLDTDLAAKYGFLTDIEEHSDSMTQHTRGTFGGLA